MAVEATFDRPATTDLQEEFARVYPEYRDQLVRYLVRSVGPRDADDIADEALARAYELLPSLSPDQPLLPWLRVVARRLACDLRRSRDRWEASGDVNDVLATSTATGPDPETSAVEADRRMQVTRIIAGALPRVSPSQRSVLWMRAVDEMSFSEIAARLGSSEVAVRQQLSKACRRLRRELHWDMESLSGLVVAPFALLLKGIRRRGSIATKTAGGVPRYAMAAAASVAVTAAGVGAVWMGAPQQTPTLHLGQAVDSVALSTATPRPAVDTRPQATTRTPATPQAPSTTKLTDAVQTPAVAVTHKLNPKPLDRGTWMAVGVYTTVAGVRVGAGTEAYQPPGGTRPLCSLPGVTCGG